MNGDAARQRAWMLFRDLERISDRDPEQEVTGIAVPVLDALLHACKDFVAEDPVVVAIDGLITPESVEGGGLRAVDAALVVHQLAAVLGPEVVSSVAVPRSGPPIDRGYPSRGIGGF